MAAIAQSVFTPDTAVGTSVGSSSAAVALPGTPASDTTLRVANVGNNPIYVKLGTTNAVTVTNGTGLCIMPGDKEYLGIGSNTYIAMTTGTPGTSSTVNLTTGS